jgi:lysophospholipase L1-like esterase
VQQDQGALVFLGDSITQGWGDNIGGAFPGVKVANRGISGDTTRGVLIRLKEDVLDLQPRAVVLLIGTNDLEEQADPETVTANLKLILAALKTHNAAMPIILCQVFPSSETKKRPADKIKKLNQLYAAAVKGDPRVIPIETWALFADASGDATLAEFPTCCTRTRSATPGGRCAAPGPRHARVQRDERRAVQARTASRASSTARTSRAGAIAPRRRQTGAAPRAGRPRTRTRAPGRSSAEPVRFDGQGQSPDGRFAVIGGRLVVTTPPEYRKIQQLWTTREFPEDFVLKLEFRATPNADSGVYLRGPQLQCRDYALAGPTRTSRATSRRSGTRLVVTVRGGVARATCNGELIEGEMKARNRRSASRATAGRWSIGASASSGCLALTARAGRD